MAELHELLAVEADKQALFKSRVDETVSIFSGKPDLFLGTEKHLESLSDELDENTLSGFDEFHELTTTVKDKLRQTFEFVNEYVDVNLQKEVTNQTAKADLVLDGITIATGLPATFLLGLESKLKTIRVMFEAIPVLAPGIAWVPDPGKGADVFKTKNPQKKFKTAKTFKHKVLYEATDKHPAQIEKWEETVNVGMYVQTVWSGMITSAEKAIMLTKLDKLIQATKQARQRANCEEVQERKIGLELMNYLIG